MDSCIRDRLVIVDDFLPAELVKSMRDDIDSHFADPQQHTAERHNVWNYWHVPGSYTYLKTSPEQVIGQEKVEGFVTALRTWAALNLGLAYVTWPFLSMYVPGCAQAVHNDSVNGRFGYVFSLTREQRKTIGGETMVFHDRDLFRSNLDKPAATIGLYDLVDPRLNRLVLFDDRVPHAVQRVDGSMDPVEGRFVLHGHIKEQGVIAQGGLKPDAIQDVVVAALRGLREMIDDGVKGPIVFSAEIEPGGKVRRIRPILDRLATSDGGDLDALRGEIAERMASLRFPSAQSETRANIPLVF